MIPNDHFFPHSIKKSVCKLRTLITLPTVSQLLFHTIFTLFHKDGAPLLPTCLTLWQTPKLPLIITSSKHKPAFRMCTSISCCDSHYIFLLNLYSFPLLCCYELPHSPVILALKSSQLVFIQYAIHFPNCLIRVAETTFILKRWVSLSKITVVNHLVELLQSKQKWRRQKGFLFRFMYTHAPFSKEM